MTCVLKGWLIWWGILECKQTPLPTLYLCGFPTVEGESYHVRAGRDLRDHHREPAWNAKEEEIWKWGGNLLSTHSYPKAGAAKTLWHQIPGLHLFPLSHIQLLTFIQRMEDCMLTSTSGNGLIWGTKTSLNMSSVPVILTCKWAKRKSTCV